MSDYCNKISGALEAIMLDLDGQPDFCLLFGSEVPLLPRSRHTNRKESTTDFRLIELFAKLSQIRNLIARARCNAAGKISSRNIHLESIPGRLELAFAIVDCCERMAQRRSWVSIAAAVLGRRCQVQVEVGVG